MRFGNGRRSTIVTRSAMYTCYACMRGTINMCRPDPLMTDPVSLTAKSKRVFCLRGSEK